MELSGKDLRRLLYMERWATYREQEGYLSLDKVIRKDEGRYFSTILSDDDIKVKSFNMKSIPCADAILVVGSPRAVVYAAELAIRYRKNYGKYPELFCVGDGRGMFAQRINMAEWYEQQMISLGFPEDWVMKHHVRHCDKNHDVVKDVHRLIVAYTALMRKITVLVVTGAGYSLPLAQELCAAIPHASFNFFEVKQEELSSRLFYCEQFSPKTYAVDTLLANVIRARKSSMVPLPVEKLLEIPQNKIIKDLLLRGYAGCFSSPDMWKAVGINPNEGMALYKSRIAQLQTTVRPRQLEKQTELLLKRTKKSFADRGLIIQ